MNQAILVTISLLIASAFVVVIPTPSFAQPCTNNASNVQGSHDKKATQIQNLENRCIVNITTATCPPGFVLSGNVCIPSMKSQLIANAGPSQTVSQGSLVTLDGTGSTPSSDAIIVSYSWVQTSGITVALSGASTATPTFIAPIVSSDTVLGFSLKVMDNHGSISTNTAVVYVMIKHNISNTPASNNIVQPRQPIPAPHFPFTPNQPLTQFHGFR
jgi:hypothetical protein